VAACRSHALPLVKTKKIRGLGTSLFSLSSCTGCEGYRYVDFFISKSASLYLFFLLHQRLSMLLLPQIKKEMVGGGFVGWWLEKGWIHGGRRSRCSWWGLGWDRWILSGGMLSCCLLLILNLMDSWEKVAAGERKLKIESCCAAMVEEVTMKKDVSWTMKELLEKEVSC